MKLKEVFNRCDAAGTGYISYAALLKAPLLALMLALVVALSA